MTDKPLHGLSILIVEDVGAIRKLVTRILESLGCSIVYEAADVDDGLAALDGRYVDVVLLDYELNNETGLRLIERLRASAEHPNRDVPIILLTAHAQVEIVQKAVVAGADGYLVKPVMPETLAERILAVLDGKTASIEPGRSTEVVWGGAKNA